MITSDLGRQFIESFEKCKLTAYDDGTGTWTIGIGRIKDVKRGDTCTEEQARDWFAEELQEYEKAVSARVKVIINQFQFDALTSFTYNVGTGALRTSTVLRKLNEGNFVAAAPAFELWNKGTVNGVLQVLPGLTKRRQAERKIFETGLYAMHDGETVDGHAVGITL